MSLMLNFLGVDVLFRDALEYNYSEAMARWREKHNIVLSEHQKKELKNRMDVNGERRIELFSVINSTKKKSGYQSLNFGNFEVKFKITESVHIDDSNHLLDKALSVPAALIIMPQLEKMDRFMRESLTGVSKNISNSSRTNMVLFNSVDFLLGTKKRKLLQHKMFNWVEESLKIQSEQVQFSAEDIRNLDKESLKEIIDAEKLPIDHFRFKTIESLRKRVLGELSLNLLEGGYNK